MGSLKKLLIFYCRIIPLLSLFARKKISHFFTAVFSSLRINECSWTSSCEERADSVMMPSAAFCCYLEAMQTFLVDLRMLFDVGRLKNWAEIMPVVFFDQCDAERYHGNVTTREGTQSSPLQSLRWCKKWSSNMSSTS